MMYDSLSVMPPIASETQLQAYTSHQEPSIEVVSRDLRLKLRYGRTLGLTLAKGFIRGLDCCPI
jgi:hypothetical protein